MNKQVLDLVEKLDEHEDGHADEAPRYVKNILASLVGCLIVRGLRSRM